MATRKTSRMQAVREALQTVFPRAGIRQHRRMKRRTAIKRVFSR
jgi:hypothetical protein